MAKKSNVKIFGEVCSKIHNNRYDYSKVVYINNKTKVKIICPIHGEFEQKPNSHKEGRGCRKCAIDNNNFYHKNRNYSYSKYSLEDFINKSNEIHNNRYDYSKVEYINNKTKVIIICPIHGEYNQLPYNHLNKKSGCLKCSEDKNAKKKRLTEDIILERLDTVNYEYDLKDYKNNSSKIDVYCKKHDIKFKQYIKHLFSGVIGCSRCNNSIGERNIKEYLDKNNIDYIEQKIFENCKYKDFLRFDFYLPKYNLCIEFDGEQHFRIVEFYGGEIGYNKRLKRDKIKNGFCGQNEINLLRIKYDQNVEKVMDGYFYGIKL